MWLDSRLDSLLARIGEDDPATRAAKAHAFQVILLIQAPAEFWYYGIRYAEQLRATGDVVVQALPWFASACALAGIARRGLRPWAFLGLAAAQLTWLVDQFPDAANHAYLTATLLLLAALLDPERENEDGLLLASARWIFVLVLFYAGVQKLVHGYYFRGEFLAFFLDVKNFQHVVSVVLSDAELARILALPKELGSGPFRFESATAIALSNAVYLTEIGGAAGLLWRRTRPLALAGIGVFLLITEIIAHELFFLGLFANGLLLFVAGDANRRLLPVFAAYYAWLLLSVARLLPGFQFT